MPRPLRVAVAFAAGVAVWIVIAEEWHQLLATVVAVTVPAEGAGGVLVQADGDTLLLGPVEHPQARARVPMAIVSANLALLIGLWGWDSGSFRGKGLRRLAAALGILGVVHGIAVLAAIHATLAVQLGEWTGNRYSTLATNGWFVLWQGYQVIGAWAAGFAIWWGLREPASIRRARGPA